MLKIYITCFFLSLVLSLLFTPFSIFLSREFEVYDQPGKRKVHTRPVPRWGGVGIYLSCVTCILACYYMFPSFRGMLNEDLMTTSQLIGNLSLKKQLMGLLAGGTFITVLGMIDDWKPVRALTKFLVQIIVAYCVMDFGVRIFGLALPGLKDYVLFPILVGQAITILWIIGFMNTINLADGLDGLAGGIVTIASGTFFIVCLVQITQTADPTVIRQLQVSALLSIVLCGTTLGFLFFNFNPAKVFMGDSGALLLGFMLASISIIGTLKTTAFLALFIPVIIVALPVLDVAFSIYRRLRSGIDIGRPDKQHLHHRLLAWGWTHREVVLFIYVVTLVLSLVAVSLTALKFG